MGGLRGEAEGREGAGPLVEENVDIVPKSLRS